MSNFIDNSSATFQLQGGRELVDVDRVKVLLSSIDTGDDPYKVCLSNKSFSSEAGKHILLILLMKMLILILFSCRDCKLY